MGMGKGYRKTQGFEACLTIYSFLWMELNIFFHFNFSETGSHAAHTGVTVRM